MWVLQHLHGFSERELCDEMLMHAGFRWFCGLSFNDKIPDQSTLVKLRTKMWAKSGIQQAFLAETVRACEAAGIASPTRLGVDGTQIQANAATVSLEEIPPALSLTSANDVVVGAPAPETDTQVSEVTGLILEVCTEGEAASDTPARCPDRPGLRIDARTDDEPGAEPEPHVDEKCELYPEARADGESGPDPETRCSEHDITGAGATQEPDTNQPENPGLRTVVGGRNRGKHKSGDPDWHGEKFSNATHRSTTDPEARLYRKGKAQDAKLRYLGHYLADVKSGVIYGAVATQATGTAEREATLAMLDSLAVLPLELPADLGYRDGAFLNELLSRGITPLVPIGEEKLEAEPTWKRKAKTPELQEQRDAKLTAARARNTVRVANRGHRGTRAQRQRTRLEHLFAEAKDHHGLARAHGRGVRRVTQQVVLTAGVQNLKRLMACRTWRKAVDKRATMHLPGHLAPTSALFGFRRPIQGQYIAKAHISGKVHDVWASLPDNDT
jgi:IS5 family transposase